MPSEPLRSFNSPCSLIPCFFGEFFLLELQLAGEVQQPHLAFLFREDFVKKSQVVAEENHGRQDH